MSNIILFPGNSCYPLSPIVPSNPHDVENFRNPKDQLKITFKKIGKQSSSSLSFIQTKDAYDYIKNIMKDIDTEQNNYLKDLEQSNPEMKSIL
jgi:hypothetical protein